MEEFQGNIVEVGWNEDGVVELAVPDGYRHVVLGCPDTQEEVVISYDDLPGLVRELTRVLEEAC